MYKLFKTGIEKDMLDTMNTIISYRYHYKEEYEKYTINGICDKKSFEKLKGVITQMGQEGFRKLKFFSREYGSNDMVIHIILVKGKKPLPKIINIIKNKFNEFKCKFCSKT